MRKIVLLFTAISCLFFNACDIKTESVRLSSTNMSLKKYSSIPSGYRDPGGEKMENFLRCWKKQTEKWMSNNSHPNIDRKPYASYAGGDNKPSPAVSNFYNAAQKFDWLSIGGFKPEAQHLQPDKVSRCPSPLPQLHTIIFSQRTA